MFGIVGTPVVSMVGPKTPKECSKESCEPNQSIQVFVRCRPLKPNERKSVVDVVSERREVRINERGGVASNTKTFTFDNAFGGETQQIDVYLSVVEPLIEQVMMGYNCTVFAYGQTGTGKTYTMEGERSSDECSWESDPECGIIPRALHQLFSRLDDQQNEHTVRVSFLELYNEELYDLLSAIDDTTKLKIYEDNARKGSTIVGGLEEITVNTKAEIYDILRKGSSKRQTASTLLNACSSRSHTIFSVTVHIKESAIDGEDMVKIGKLNLVDLAGSENIGRSGAIDKRAREAGNINQSLLTLGRVITCLVEKAPHVPYRESKLTRLLQDSLGGRTKTSIIATISPNILDAEDTISTLEYAQRAKKIMNKPEINQKMSKKTLLREYTAEIERLRRDLAASREKNGFYINEENYNEMQEKIKIQNEENELKTANIQVLNEEIAKIQSLFEKTNEELQVKCVELEKTSNVLKQTSNELSNTLNVLCVTKVERDEQKHLVDKHVDSEKVLLSQAQQLLSVADNTTTDAEKLHAKIDRQMSIETLNQLRIDEFQKKIVNDMKRMEELVCVYTSTQHDDTKDLENIVMNNYDQLNDDMSKVRDGVNYLSNFTKDSLVLAQSIDLKDNNKALSAEIIAFHDCMSNEVNNSHVSLENGLKSIEDTIASQRIANKQLIAQNNTYISNITEFMKNSFEQIKTDIELMSGNYSKELLSYKNEISRLQNERIRSQQTIISLANNIIEEENKAAVEMHKFCSDSVDKFNLALISAQSSANKTIDNINKFTNNILVEEKVAFECNEKISDLNAENAQQIINQCNEIQSLAKEKFDETKSTINSNKSKIMAQSDKCVKLNETIVESIDNEIIEKQRALTAMSEQLIHSHENVGKARENVSVKIEEMNQIASTMEKTQIREIVNRSKEIERFMKSDIIVYNPTGVTPQKTSYNYPRNLVQTSPHDRILQRYRALMEPLDAINAPLPEESDFDSEFYSDSSISSRVESSSSLSSVNNENVPLNNTKSSIDCKAKTKSGSDINKSKEKNGAKSEKICPEIRNQSKKSQMIPLKAKNNN